MFALWWPAAESKGAIDPHEICHSSLMRVRLWCSVETYLRKRSSRPFVLESLTSVPESKSWSLAIVQVLLAEQVVRCRGSVYVQQPTNGSSSIHQPNKLRPKSLLMCSTMHTIPGIYCKYSLPRKPFIALETVPLYYPVEVDTFVIAYPREFRTTHAYPWRYCQGEGQSARFQAKLS